MTVVGYDPYPFPEAAESLNKNVTVNNILMSFSRLRIIITLHVPLTPETKEMIGKLILIR
jgi:phosphoglycerate dehydrogenase-like enzyme